MNTCFSTSKTKYFSRTTERLFLIDLKNGDYWDFNDKKMNIFDRSRIEDYCVLKIKHYYFSAFDFQSMQEKWNTMTSEIEYYSYTQYLISGHQKLAEKQLREFIIVRDGANKIEIMKSTDESVIRAIEIDADILNIHSLDDETKEFFKLKLTSVNDAEIGVIFLLKK